MDPNATLRILLESIEDGDRDQTCQCLEDLLEWLEHGGFMPQVVLSAANEWCINPQE